MPTITIINPNSSSATTEMMVGIASAYADGAMVEGLTAVGSPPLIVDEEALRASAPEVVALGCGAVERRHSSGLIVAAFGDPGLEELRRRVRVPVTGLCEAGMLAAAAGGRKFSVATTTPKLVAPIAAKAALLGLDSQFLGVRLTRGDPAELTADPATLRQALADAVLQCVKGDGAEAVIIGGGPLGQAALALSEELGLPVIAPLREAVLTVMRLIAV